MTALAVTMRVVVVVMMPVGMIVRHARPDYGMAPRRLPNHPASASNAA